MAWVTSENGFDSPEVHCFGKNSNPMFWFGGVGLLFCTLSPLHPFLLFFPFHRSHTTNWGGSEEAFDWVHRVAEETQCPGGQCKTGDDHVFLWSDFIGSDVCLVCRSCMLFLFSISSPPSGHHWPHIFYLLTGDDREGRRWWAWLGCYESYEGRCYLMAFQGKETNHSCSYSVESGNCEKLCTDALCREMTFWMQNKLGRERDRKGGGGASYFGALLFPLSFRGWWNDQLYWFFLYWKQFISHEGVFWVFIGIACHTFSLPPPPPLVFVASMETVPSLFRLHWWCLCIQRCQLL